MSNRFRPERKICGDWVSDGKEVKDSTTGKTVAVSAHLEGAEIIAKALNFYFGNTYTRNDAVEMMHKNTGQSLDSIADYFEKHEYTGRMAIEFLRETAEEMKAQALVVSMRDELKFGKPNEGNSP